jgi:hypothetical protein
VPAEAFNVLNHSNDTIVGRLLNAPTFGRVQGQLDPRQIRLGAKLLFQCGFRRIRLLVLFFLWRESFLQICWLTRRFKVHWKFGSMLAAPIKKLMRIAALVLLCGAALCLLTVTM